MTFSLHSRERDESSRVSENTFETSSLSCKNSQDIIIPLHDEKRENISALIFVVVGGVSGISEERRRFFL